MIAIQPEREKDYSAIHEINVLAFGRENEARLVNKIREALDFIPELSLVAIKNGRVVGHILFSRITIQSKAGSFPALALAPMAVHPKFQNQGIGSKLVRQGWSAAEIGVIKLSLWWPPPILSPFWILLCENERA